MVIIGFGLIGVIISAMPDLSIQILNGFIPGNQV